MKRFVIAIVFLISISTIGSSQYYIGVKGGIGLNWQQWNSFERNILFTPLIDLYIESHDDSVNKMYASLGFHQRGSGVRGFGFESSNQYKFNNAVLEVGFKQVLGAGEKYNAYYMLGGRLEYTVTTNLGERPIFSVYSLVNEEYVNKFNYGLTIGGGFEQDLSPTRIVFFEASINPDASRQYHQPQAAVVINPYPTVFNPDPTITITPQEVRNISLEVKVGIKFLQDYWEEDY